MRNSLRRNHMIDLLFPIALFFVFTVSAIVVILLATRIYQSTADTSFRNDTARTALTYISERIHQNDSLGGISLGNYDGCEALILTHSEEQAGYTTYIYVHEGQLKELFIKNGVSPSASVGKTIISVEDFLMEEIDMGLYRFSCLNIDGKRISTLVGTYSNHER